MIETYSHIIEPISVHSRTLVRTPHRIQCVCDCCKHAEVGTRGLHSSMAHTRAPAEKFTPKEMNVAAP